MLNHQVIPPGSNKDFAVVSGIQIHGPEGHGYFWVQDMYEVTQGKRTELMDAYNKTVVQREDNHGQYAFAFCELTLRVGLCHRCHETLN